jgi:hypothetical protein
MSKSAVCRLIHKVETLLMDSGQFRLPGKKQLYQNAQTWQVVAVDVTEREIERPKKTTAFLLQWQTETAHPKSPSLGESGQWADHLHCIWQRTSS